MRTLDHWEREDRRARQLRRTRENYAKGMEWALSQGFSKRLAPFAVSAAEVLKGKTHGKPVTKEMVEAEMRESWPWLGFEEAS